MSVPMNMKHPRASHEVGRVAGIGVASAAALAALAMGAAPVFAANSIKAGVGGTTIVVNGRTISTSNLTLAQFAKLQGVPESDVGLELDGVAAGNPAAPAVEALVATLTGQTALATALNGLSAASGTAASPASQAGPGGVVGPAPTAISPATALEEVVLDNGQPGASNASNGSSGAAGVNGSASGTAASRRRFSLRVTSRSLKGRPRSRVAVHYSLSAAAKLIYSGSRLAGGSRKVGSGNGVLMVRLPAKHGNYVFKLKALSATEGESASTTVRLHDAPVKPVRKVRG
jgi:hypothetical protein